jgi:putative transposase
VPAPRRLASHGAADLAHELAGLARRQPLGQRRRRHTQGGELLDEEGDPLRAWRDGGTEALRSKGPVSRERLSPQQWARLELELRRGPLAHGFANDQRWTLGRIKTLIGKLFHVGYTVEGTSKLMRRHGWSAQVPVRQAMERDDEAVAVWKAEVWPDIKARRATWAPSSASRTRRARG